MKRRTIALVVSMVLALAVGLGGTLAYLTDRDSDVNVFAIGNVDIELTEDFRQGAELIPGKKIEKEVSVVNTGNNDAWVWTTIAIPTALDNDDASKNVLHFNFTAESIADGLWNWMDENDNYNVKKVTIDSVEYNLYTVMYETKLQPGETTAYPVMTQVYLDYHVDVDPNGDMFHVKGGVVEDLEWNLNDDGAPKMYVAAYAIQTEGFDTVQEGYAAYGEQWGTNENATYEEIVPVVVTTNDALKAALTANEVNIYVELAADLTYDVAAWENDAMGGDTTRKIEIIGNGHTLTFNQTNSDWNNIATKNGAKLYLKDINITNAGHNNGPWNRHDLNFACNVSMINVNSDKAMAFKAGAFLKDVTISDANTSDTYAIWIQPNGQKVTLDNVTIDMLACSDGRGIKIDEEYVSDPQKVTLTVKDTTFKTEEKAAIIVKCKTGAKIILNNVDITGVAADSTNPVWVDEASADYKELVTVTGGTKIVEP